MKKFYPVGSVVSLKITSKSEMPLKVVIIGRMFKTKDNPEIIDYIALPYPFGYRDLKGILYFKEEDIKEVLFTGYEDNDEKNLKDFLITQYEMLELKD